MTPNILALRYSCTALAAAGALAGALTIPAGPAAAQMTYRTTTGEITIIAPHVQRRELGRSGTGIPIEELSLSRGVNYSDLDLSRWDDVQLLDDRIRHAAYSACRELNRQYPEALYPSYQSNASDCVVNATNEGRAQARWVVAQWSGYPRYDYPPYGE
jgi:UrcA family protein